MNTKDRDIKFTKMHGAGNDYVYIDCISGECPADLSELAIRIADRHFGVGGDGLVVILPSVKADFRMRMFNSDGSEAQMCGNASRCVAKYLYDNDYSRENIITLETLAGIKKLYITPATDGEVRSVTVDMGIPIVDPSAVPAFYNGVDHPAKLSLDENVECIAVSMGNPHGVIFTDDLSDANVIGNGSRYEKHEVWPEKANIEFVKVIDAHTVEMRVWERGTGETLACGTGACAAAVAGILTGRLNSPVEVRLKGGTLNIEWRGFPYFVMMTGPATTVAEGRFHRYTSSPPPPLQV